MLQEKCFQVLNALEGGEAREGGELAQEDYHTAAPTAVQIKLENVYGKRQQINQPRFRSVGSHQADGEIGAQVARCDSHAGGGWKDEISREPPGTLGNP